MDLMDEMDEMDGMDRASDGNIRNAGGAWAAGWDVGGADTDEHGRARTDTD